MSTRRSALALAALLLAVSARAEGPTPPSRPPPKRPAGNHPAPPPPNRPLPEVTRGAGLTELSDPAHRPNPMPEFVYHAIALDKQGRTVLPDGRQVQLTPGQIETAILGTGLSSGGVRGNQDTTNPALPQTEGMHRRILQYVAGGPAAGKPFPRNSNFVGISRSMEIAVSTILSTQRAVLDKPGASILLIKVKTAGIADKIVDSERLITDVVLGRVPGVKVTRDQAKKLQGHYWPMGELAVLGKIPPENFAEKNRFDAGPGLYGKGVKARTELQRAVALKKAPSDRAVTAALAAAARGR